MWTPKYAHKFTYFQLSKSWKAKTLLKGLKQRNRQKQEANRILLLRDFIILSLLFFFPQLTTQGRPVPRVSSCPPPKRKLTVGELVNCYTGAVGVVGMVTGMIRPDEVFSFQPSGRLNPHVINSALSICPNLL